jgi:hypothetical protein
MATHPTWKCFRGPATIKNNSQKILDKVEKVRDNLDKQVETLKEHLVGLGKRGRKEVFIADSISRWAVYEQLVNAKHCQGNIFKTGCFLHLSS